MGNTDRKNVIVVGAGASKEFGLPTGAELKSEIAKIADIRFDDWGQKLISGDYRFVETLRLLQQRNNDGNRSINPYLFAGWKIRDNMPLAPSIDNFLDTHSQDKSLVEFGKLAIVIAILAAERESLLFPKGNRGGQLQLEFTALQHTWLSQLFQILVAKRDFGAFLAALQNITFVSFNYDRCIHQFFVHAASSYFALGQEEVRKLIGVLNVLYPYGSVGEYSFVQNGTSNFGTQLRGQNLIDVAANLRTFTEGAGGERRKKIKVAFDEAEIVMFMGFGFLDLNVELLFGKESFEVKRVLATAKGLSNNSRQEVFSELKAVFRKEGAGFYDEPIEDGELQVLDCTCGDLIFEFQRYLAG